MLIEKRYFIHAIIKINLEVKILPKNMKLESQLFLNLYFLLNLTLLNSSIYFQLFREKSTFILNEIQRYCKNIIMEWNGFGQFDIFI